ncbi:hypothetical protein [Sphingobacterium sp. T2]|uniref:hypothetical protein n=1 Tax=Sphingobacterium sp. T2 TaxID=1590596 RepID=UPI001E509333|nr:hypothetical protein [Sphingobacterium sp. T2]
MNSFEQSYGFRTVLTWLQQQTREPFSFQLQTWKKIAQGYSGMVVAPTGFGKTYSVFYRNIDRLYESSRAL